MSAAGYSRRAFGRSALHYILGRISNALLAFLVFALVARHLPASQYALYVAAFACLELGLVIFGFGMEWVTAVYIPQMKLKGGGRALSRFIWQCAALQGGMLAGGALLMGSTASYLAGLLELQDAAAVLRLYALVMLVEGVSRVFRDQLLSCLLQQGAAQISQLARNLVMLGFALQLSQQPGWANAQTLAWAELGAASLSLFCSLLALGYPLYLNRVEPAADPGWQRPAWSRMLAAGRNAWLSNLANLSWGGQVVILLASRWMGPETTAALGFARNLSEQVRRYMPMEFLFGVIRPMLIARYTQDGDAHRLALRGGLMYRANLLFLLPLLALVLARGGEVCAFLSNGRYEDAQGLLLGWLLVLVFWAHHRVSDLLAHALGRSGITSRVSAFLLLTPLLLATAAWQQSYLGMFAVLAAAELAYSLLVLRQLGIYRLNWKAMAMQFALLLPGVMVASLPWGGAGILWELLLSGMLVFGVILGGTWLLRAWSREEAAVLPLERLFRWQERCR